MDATLPSASDAEAEATADQTPAPAAPPTTEPLEVAFTDDGELPPERSGT